MDVIGTREWKPNKKQEKFLALPDKIFEGLYGGAAGGGKSEVLGLLPIIRRFHEHPRFKGLLLRRTFPELNQEIIPRMMDYYKGAGASYNDQKKCWKWPSGALIFAGHIEHEADVKQYDTSEWNYIGFDELTSFTKYQYIYLVASRCRTSSDDLPAFCRSGTNPGNVGHAWVKEHFQIDKVPSLTVIRDKVSGNLKVFVQALLTDNPYIDQNYSNNLELLRTVSMTDYLAKKLGDWNVFEGQVFGDFRLSPLPGEPENAKHVITPYNIPEWYPIIVAIDWGFAAMAYALFAAIAPNKQIYIFKEYGKKNALISEWASDVLRISQDLNVRSVVIDPSSKQKRGEAKNIFEQVYEIFSKGDLGHKLHVADNDRIGGKLLVQEFLRWRARPKQFEITEKYDNELASRILKWQGMEAYEKYINKFREDNPSEEVLPRLQIFETCPILINTIPKCIYDETDKEDVKEFDGDDPYDTLRYLLKEVDNYSKSVTREQEVIEEKAKVEEQHVRTGDTHNYYMRMRQIEERQRLKNAAISRFHNPRKSFPFTQYTVR